MINTLYLKYFQEKLNLEYLSVSKNIYNKYENSDIKNKIDEIFKISNKKFKNEEDKDFYDNIIKNISRENKLEYVYDGLVSYINLFLLNKNINESNKIANIYNEILKSELGIDNKNTKIDSSLEINKELDDIEFPSFDRFIRKIKTTNYDLFREDDKGDENVKILAGIDSNNGMCLNENKSNSLRNLPIDFRKLDSNGNTVLNKLVDQFNKAAIESVITKVPMLVTYKNENNELPYEYCLNKIKSQNSNYQINKTNDIYSDSESLFLNKMKKYSKSIKTSVESNTEFEGLEFPGSNEYSLNVFLNSIFLLGEYIWEVIEDSIGNDCENELWTNDDINELKKLLFKNFSGEYIKNTNNLFINKKKVMSNINKNNNNKVNKKTSKAINQKIEEYNKKIEELIKLLNKNEGNPRITQKLNIKLENYGSALNKLKEQIRTDKNKEKEEGQEEKEEEQEEEKEDTKNNIYDEAYNIEEEEFYGSGGDFIEDSPKYYHQMKEINEYIMREENASYPCEIIFKLLDNKLVDKMLLDKNDENVNKEYKVLAKFYDCVYKPMYSNYMDLDKYENITYNRLSSRIIEILHINVVNTVKYDLYYSLMYVLSSSSGPYKFPVSEYSNPCEGEGLYILKIIDNILFNTMLKDNQLLDEEVNDYSEETQVDNLISKLIEIGRFDTDNDKEEATENIKKYVNFYKAILLKISTGLLEQLNGLIELLKINSVILPIGKIICDKYVEEIKK